MSGLSLICEYGDEETQSDESSVENSYEQDYPKPKLPKPDLSRVTFVSLEEHIDDSEVHGGRVRTFPHVRGNWATFVYIEYPDKENLLKLIDTLAASLATIDDSCCKLEEIHISLSKTFILKYHMINAFTSSLQNIINNNKSFVLGFDSVEVYCNEDKTRTFIALKVESYFAQKYLTDISKKIDNLLEEFRLPQFYDEPSFHMSIISINGDKKQDVLKVLSQLNQYFDQERLETVVINKVNCKSGNKVYQFPLK